MNSELKKLKNNQSFLFKDTLVNNNYLEEIEFEDKKYKIMASKDEEKEFNKKIYKKGLYLFEKNIEIEKRINDINKEEEKKLINDLLKDYIFFIKEDDYENFDKLQEIFASEEQLEKSIVKIISHMPLNINNATEDNRYKVEYYIQII